MNHLHHLSLQTAHIDPSFGNRSGFNTGKFFQEILLLIQWATYHHRPLSDFTPVIQEDLEGNGIDAELNLHFDHLLHYSNGPATDSTPTIRDLHPNILSPSIISSQPTSTIISETITANFTYELSSDDNTSPHAPSPSLTIPITPESPPVRSVINTITTSPPPTLF